MKNLILIGLFITCLLTSCNVSTSKQAGHQDKPGVTGNFEETINNTIQHYWDNLNVIDTATLFRKEVGEQQLVDYLYLLNKTSAGSAHDGLITLLDKMLTNQALFDHFIGLIEKYLDHPDSPLRNEEQYISVLEYCIKDERLDARYKIRPQYQLSMLYKNRLGHAAEDFNYITPSANKGSLSKIDAPLTLLLFYDPDCENCRETISQLSNSKMLKAMQRKKELQVLAIYTADNLGLWKDYASSIPAEWINGSDKQQIHKQKKYDLRAFPTFYLLDKDKKVLLKDAYMDVVMDTLGTIANKKIG
ncbi:DUF5106 domain-containing protein [Pedobacter alluvionis]|uniref:DUF5106 domain-containing protein n=1 Tax=Pedobacter alluvionis TaxID=475253 RepID=A0A497Y7W7_9SPHI|nr:DUF5106 domain-containing protein [Pedobacter alluvionis]RLJ79654.1 thioredoxin-like protein [Pedobacter alluvionis]TFB30980.1 DUF5106 domain-containing protein [Pedobacter alluvionis]